MSNQKYVATVSAKKLYPDVNPLLVRTVGQCVDGTKWNEDALLYVGYVPLSRVHVDINGSVNVNEDAVMKNWNTEWPEDHVEVCFEGEMTAVTVNLDRLSEGGLRLTDRPDGAYVTATKVAVVAETKEALKRFGGTMEMFADGQAED